MTFNGFVKFSYKNIDNSYQISKNYDDLLSDQHITIESQRTDLNIHQYFELFKSFLAAVGFAPLQIMKGAAQCAFNDSHSEQDMTAVADEYDLVLSETLYEKIKKYEDESLEWQEKYEKAQDEVNKLQIEVINLSADLCHVKTLDDLQQTESKTNAISNWNKKKENKELRQKLENANVVCFDCGKKYGTYSTGSSSVWTGICNVCGKTKSITESRDFNFLKQGIDQLKHNNLNNEHPN